MLLVITGCGESSAPDPADAVSLDSAMAAVGEGWFVMGSIDGRSNEIPTHDVWLDAFEIDRYEVTVAQYAVFVGSTGWRLPGDWDAADPALPGNSPVTHVAWPDAVGYCEWVGKRLPTEAEWEKAARGGDERRYPWGDTWDPSRAAVALEVGPGPVGAHPAGSSPYGAYDMAGNVHEWVWDYYDEAYYEISPAANPRGPENNRNHVIRGGSWASPAEWATTTFRDSSHSDVGDARFGFRCAR